jgi:hypothetical protein
MPWLICRLYEIPPVSGLLVVLDVIMPVYGTNTEDFGMYVDAS